MGIVWLIRAAIVTNASSKVIKESYLCYCTHKEQFSANIVKDIPLVFTVS